MIASSLFMLLVKVTVAAALGLGAALLARRSRASLRHVLLAATFVVLGALPLMSLVVPAIDVVVPIAEAAPPVSPSATQSPLSNSDFVPPVTASTSALTESNAVGLATPSFNPSTTSVLLLVWIAGAVLFVVPVAVGLTEMRSLRRTGVPSAQARTLVDVMASDAGISRRVEVMLHELTPGPLTFGAISPAILLPADAETWAEEDVRRAVIHELEHVRRGDWITQCLARVVCALYWFHPLVWIAWRRFALEAERACDDAVLGRSEATAYANQLVGLARRLSTGQRQPLLAMANRADLSTRVTAVLDIRQQRGRAGTRVVTIGAVVSALLVLVISPLRVVTSAAARQQTTGLLPTFEIVSIKPCPGLDVVRPPGSGRGANPRAPQISLGFVHWDCVALAELIDQAYAGKDNQLLNSPERMGPESPKRVRGGPSWVESDRFTIEAKMSSDATDATGAARFVQVRDAMAPALRALIEDRFQLKLHKATEQRSMYALTVAKSGLNKNRMTLAVQGGCWESVPGRGRGAPPGFEGKPMCGNVHGTRPRANHRYEYTSVTLSQLAVELSHVLDRVVLDKTSVDGRFNFAIEFAPDDNTPGDRPDPAAEAARAAEMAASGVPPDPRPDGPTIFQALEALGLHLGQTKGPSEYIQIDSVQRPRSDFAPLGASSGRPAPSRAAGPGKTNR